MARRRKKNNMQSILTITLIYAVIIAAAVTWITLGDVPTWSSDEGNFDKAQQTGTFANLDAEYGVVGGVGIQIQQEDLPDIPDGSGEKRGAVFVINNMGLELFSSGTSAGIRYANVINQYPQVLGDDVQVYNMVIPSHCAFAIPEKYSEMVADQSVNIQAICDALDPSVKGINIYPALRRHCDEYLYFNTDHHWTQLGAYYAYQYFCLSANFTALELDDFEERKIDSNFLGTLYSGTLDAGMASNPDTVYYYMPPGEYSMDIYTRTSPTVPYTTTMYNENVGGSSSYLAFIHGDNPLSVIKNEGQTNGRKIVVVKESYGNAFAPLLAYHYEEVHVVDQRYFTRNLNAYMEENGIQEILVINNIFAAHTGVRTDEVQQLLYN